MVKESKYIVGTRRAAEYLGVSAITVKRHWQEWATQKRISWPAKMGNRLRFIREELDDLHRSFQIVKG